MEGGNVQLRLLVDTRGTVADARVANGSGHPALDAAAQKVAAIMEFTPAKNRRTLAPMWTRQAVRLQL